MLGDFLIAITVLVLLCLYGSDDRAGPYEMPHDIPPNDDLFDA